MWQVLCLRLGVIKCHARGDVNAQAMQIKRNGTVAELSFPTGWAETHPRTLHLLEEEAAAWERGGPLRLELRR
jgi:exopolyphosphatase / guanosine-5'-triphosphate,3'-diphosphate pyrophosphatase